MKIYCRTKVKGTVPRDFQLQVLFMDQFPKPLSIPQGPFQIFLKICRNISSFRCTTGVVDIGGKWEKSSIREVYNILFGHLWVVE
jgi:hypothetical protein